jgi:hypothetical protein
MMEASVLEWLLEDNNPSVRYRTLTELLAQPAQDAAVRAARSQIIGSPAVRKILAKMHPDGYWLYRGLGEGVDYAMSSSTHFVLAYLSELGLDRTDPPVAKAVERYLSLSEVDLQASGKWLRQPDYLSRQSCLYAYNIRTFVRMGYREDPRVQARIAMLLSDKRWDGGYLCVRTSFNESTKSCVRGTLKALTAFAELPELWSSQCCQDLVDYFLKRRVMYRLDQPEQLMRAELASAIFPFAIHAGLLEHLNALSRMGLGDHPALQPAWQALENKRDETGRYHLDWYPPSYFIPGPKGQANKWVTFYALLALKQKSGSFASIGVCPHI